MAVAHAGPPTLALVIAYLKLKKKHNECHENITFLLNGGLQEKIKKSLSEALKEKVSP